LIIKNPEHVCFLNIGAFNLFLLLFQAYGVIEGASAAIVFNWDLLCFIPLLGLNIAIVSLCGRIVGENNIENIDQVTASGFLLGLGYATVLGIVFFTFRVPLVELFITPGVDYAAIRELSTFMMMGLSSYVVADAIIQVCGGVLRGAGDTQWILKTTVTLHWTMLVIQIIVIKGLNFGPRASWLLFVVMIISIAVLFLMRWRSDHWRNAKTIERMLAET